MTNLYLKLAFLVVLCQSCSANDFIETVHIVFMNHLDVGYADLANNILNRYFVNYFAQAAALGETLAQGRYEETFIYTTHPWLVSLFLDCPPNFNLSGVQLKCPNATELATFKSAVAKGYITWHAGPMNLQPENSVDWLFQFGLQLGIDLDKSLGINRKMRVLSQRDVPGMTQAVIPHLLEMGVSGVSVGVNPATSPPAVPKLFRWQYDGKEVLATYHKGGYPNNPGPNPRNPGGISRDDCAILPGFSHALCFAFRTDNSGPPQSLQELLGYYEILRVEFPMATLRASTLEDFFQALVPVKDKLPVVTQEIGDTWIQGIASDPRKMAEFRAVTRVMGTCLKSGECSMKDSRIYNSSRLMVKLSEHTWGLANVGDTVNWTNAAFSKAKTQPNFKKCITSWQEQRNFTYIAIEALGNHSVVGKIIEELEETRAKMPDLSGYIPLFPDQWSKTFQCNKYLQLAFNPDGSLGTLTYNGSKWASPLNPLGQFMYQTFDKTDFDNFGKVYNYGGGSAGYYKNNMTVNAHPESRTWPATMRALYMSSNGACDFYLQLKMLDSRSYIKYGAPRDIWINYKATPVEGIDVVLQLFDKTSTRLPESLMFNFKPLQEAGAKWTVSKLGQAIDPLHVIQNGSQRQHVADDGGIILTSHPALQISSLDLPIVCVASDTSNITPFPYLAIMNQSKSFAFNIYNNIWDTNYILWFPYEDRDNDFKARFKIRF